MISVFTATAVKKKRSQYDLCAYNNTCHYNETHLPYGILQSALCPCASQLSVSLLSAAIH